MSDSDREVMKLEGDLNRETVPRLRKRLLREVRRNKGLRRLTVDLSRVGRMDSAGVALLVELWRVLHPRKGGLRVVHVDERARSMIRMARLSEIFGMEEASRENASEVD